MGTEVLRPQDCLTGRIGHFPADCTRRRYGNAYSYHPNYFNGRCHRKSIRSEARKRYRLDQSDPSVSRRSLSPEDSKSLSKNMVMENVTIWRRGESLDSKMKSGKPSKENDGGLIVAGTDRLGPGPELVPRHSRIVDVTLTRKSDVYAGSAFVVSPAPSSLPLPSFSKKKQIPFDNLATQDLRRLLRLDDL